MPKRRLASGKNEPAQDSQKLFARAYGSRLAKEAVKNGHRNATPRKKHEGKG